jgi:uncharacterized OB-fold protein
VTETLGPTRTFDEGLRSGRLIYQRCNACSTSFHRPRLACPSCGSPDFTWLEAAGTGTVYSVTTVERPPPAFRADAPFQVALVDVDEGFRAMGRIVGEPVSIGTSVVFLADQVDEQSVRVAFEAVSS